MKRAKLKYSIAQNKKGNHTMFEILVMNNTTEDNTNNKFMTLVKNCTQKICRMNNLTFIDKDKLFLLGEASA